MLSTDTAAHLIDLYPGDLAIESVPARFEITMRATAYYPRSLDDFTGNAELVSAQIGGLSLARWQVQEMIGSEALDRIEEEIFALHLRDFAEAA